MFSSAGQVGAPEQPHSPAGNRPLQPISQSSPWRRIVPFGDAMGQGQGPKRLERDASTRVARGGQAERRVTERIRAAARDRPAAAVLVASQTRRGEERGFVGDK